MSDLIRRMDAVQACQVGPSDEWSRSTKSGYNQAATDCAMNILRIAPALPAAQPDAHAYKPSMDPNDRGECVICGGGPHTAVQPDAAAIREVALREAEKDLRKWQDNLILCGYKEAPITVGMAADLVLALIAKPAVQPDRERVAFEMWKAEADRAAPNVGKHRTPEGFRVAAEGEREKWLGLADAAIRAMRGGREMKDLIKEIKFETVNSEIDRKLAGRIIVALLDARNDAILEVLRLPTFVPPQPANGSLPIRDAIWFKDIVALLETGEEVMPDVPHAPDVAPASTDDAGGGATREEVAEALWIANRNGFDAQLRPRFADIESYNRNHWLKLADVAIEKIKGEKK